MPNSRVQFGIHFRLTDRQIVRSFIYKIVVERKPLMPPYNNLVHEEDLFGTKEPWNIWEEYGGDQHYNQDLYFLCKVKGLNSTGLHIHRKTEHGGTWIELSEGEPSNLVYHAEENGNLNPMGRKRKFLYENLGAEEHARWCLDEYSLLVGADGRDPKASKNYHTKSYFDLVICRLRKNERSCGYKRKYRSTKEITKSVPKF